MGIRKLIILFIIFCFLSINYTNSQNKNIPVDKVIKTIKQLNFVIITLGILSDGLPNDIINKLVQLQTAPPRSMRIYVTQSKLIAGDIFNDFTTLVNEKQCNAIFIWPSKAMSDPFIVKNICKMSKLKKIPLIVMQEGWLENGALIYIKNTNPIEIVVNEQVRKVLNFPINESPDYTLIKQGQ